MKKILSAAIVSLCIAGTASAFADNLFPNSRMDAKNGWMTWLAKPVTAAGGFGKLEDGCIVVKSPDFGLQSSATSLQVIGKVDVPSDKVYVLKVKIKSDKAGSIPLDYAQLNKPYAVYATSTMDVQPGEKEYTCKLDVKKDKDGQYESPRAIRMFVGDMEDANLTFSEVSLEEAAQP